MARVENRRRRGEARFLQETESRLRGFIVDELLEEGRDGGEDPLTGDAVDSLGLEQLVEYIEEEFGVSIGSEEMVRSNFDSIPALAALVDAKLAEATT